MNQNAKTEIDEARRRGGKEESRQDQRLARAGEGLEMSFSGGKG